MGFELGIQTVLTSEVTFSDNPLMKTSNRLYKRHRFPPEIIQYAVWLYFKFNLGHRDIEDLLTERGIPVSYEAIRLWCNKFGPKYAKKLRKKHQGLVILFTWMKSLSKSEGNSITFGEQ